MAPNGATIICDKLGLLQDFPHEVGEEGEQQQDEDASNPNQEVSGQSRGVYFSLVHAEKLLSHPGKGNREIRLSRYRLPTVLSVQSHSGYTSRRS